MNQTNINIESKQKEDNLIGNELDRKTNLNKLKSALISELDFQIDLASRAFDDLEDAIEESDEVKVWYFVHIFLFTSERISELLEKSKELCELYEDSIELQELKSLLEMSSDQKMRRNGLIENFADELEEGVLDPNNLLVMENHIFQKHEFPDLDLTQMFRHFDPETYEMSLRGKTYDLREYHDEVQKMKQNLEEIYRENHWTL